MDLDSSALARAQHRLRKTTLAAYTGDLFSRFRDCGYADATIIRYVRNIAHMGEWLGRKQLAPSDLNKELAVEFLDHHLPRCRCRARVDRDRKNVRAALGHLVEVLHQRNAVADVPQDHLSPDVRRELDQFDEHLNSAHGASENTRTSRRRYVRYFLIWRFHAAPIVPENLRAEDFRHFLLDRSRTCRPGTVGVIATTLRSYLRYLVLRGYSVEPLIHAIPAVASWSKARLPQHLTEDQEKRFLRAADRTRPSGRRDYAMFLVMCRLGLRVSDVAALTLDDIDWRNGTLSVHVPKSRKIHLLPLPSAVGDAIVAYLRDGRPCSRNRHLFLRHRPPVGQAVSTDVVRGAVRRAYESAGLPSSWTGTHRLRHTAAVRMVQGRATIKQIADVLGHRCIDTTMIYAKVDLKVLRDVALPWPGRTA